MFYIVEIDGPLRNTINKNGQPDKYSEPKMFKTAVDAQKWIDRHSYKGMSMRYEIREAMTK